MKVILFTQEGYDNLKTEQQQLTEKRKETVEHLKKAREMGDLSENGYYKAAKFELGQIDRRIRKVTELIRYGKVAQTNQKDIVAVGSIVTITDGNETRKWAIVGGYESNPAENKLSNVSPIGKALLGKKVGGVVIINTPGGKSTYTITEIETA